MTARIKVIGTLEASVRIDENFLDEDLEIFDGEITASKIEVSDTFFWLGPHKFDGTVDVSGVLTFNNGSIKLGTSVTVTTDNSSGWWFNLVSDLKSAGLLLVPSIPSATLTANDGAGNYSTLGLGSGGMNWQFGGNADLAINSIVGELNEVMVAQGNNASPVWKHLCPPIRYSWTDFPSPNAAQSQDPYFGTALASGVQSASPGATFLVAGVLGLCMIRSSSTTNSGFSWLTTNIDRILGQADLYFRCILAIADDMTSKTVRFGFLDSSDHNAPTDGTYFELVAGSLSCAARSANNATRSSHGTTFTLTANTFYVFEIYWTSTSSIKYTIKSLDEATTHLNVDKTTDIPTGTSRTFGAGLIATSTILATDDLVVVDYMGHGFKNRR